MLYKSPFKVENPSKIYNKLQNGSGVIVFGTGNMGNIVLAALKKAKSRQAVLNCYWKHKAQHERLLKKHLREEMAQVNRIKSKIKYK